VLNVQISATFSFKKLFIKISSAWYDSIAVDAYHGKYQPQNTQTQIPKLNDIHFQQ
jgi:hypothetical protein